MRIATVVITLLLTYAPGRLLAACTDGTQSSGAKFRICLPDGVWNRQLVVYAHGYVSPDKPVAIPEEQLMLPDGTSLPATFTSFGYAFATSSYRANGLAILQGRDDLKDLTDIFNAKYGKPDATYIGGVSEGGLVAALSAEQLPLTYNAALAACGPIGSFSGQVNYFADIRVLFDYFFPGVLPGTVVSVPAELWTNWDTVYVSAVKSALAANPEKAQNFINSSHIPTSTDPAVTVDNILAALKYSGMSTNDAKAKLGGQPYDNTNRFFFGSINDFELNARIPRYAADPAAVQAMKPYDTTGKLQMPLVTLHTTADPVVPWLHETGYFFKYLAGGSRQTINQIPVFRNGHCNFEAGDVLWAFLVMLAQKQGTSPQTAAKTMTEVQRQSLPMEVRRRLALP